jgi:hypothetical protein
MRDELPAGAPAVWSEEGQMLKGEKGAEDV